jgi:short-subunit dehydrogenase
MKLGLENKIVLITGGTGGIGSQMVADFLEEHATVICLIRNEKKMSSLIKWIKEQNISVEQLHHYTYDFSN